MVELIGMIIGHLTNTQVNTIEGKNPSIFNEYAYSEIIGGIKKGSITAADVFAFEKGMKDLCSAMRSQVYEDMLEQLRKSDDEIELNGITIKRVSIPQYEFSDAVLAEYESKMEQIKKQQQTLNDSIKTRKEHLIESGTALKLSPKEQVRTYA